MTLDKIIKEIGRDKRVELDSLAKQDLNKAVVQANQAMHIAHGELEANAQYQTLKESLKAITAATRELNKRQKAIISYCMHLLEGK